MGTGPSWTRLDGARPCRRRTTRTASPRTPAPRVAGVTSTPTDVITPSVPSLPRISWRRSGPGRRLRRPAELERPLRRRHPHPDDALVEASVAGRRLTARPSRREAADRRVLKRLREVAERVAALAEQRLRLWAAQPRLERRRLARPRRARPADSAAAHPGRSSPAKPSRSRCQPADDRRAAAERDDRDQLLRAHPQHGQNLVVGAGEHDGVGRVGGVSGAQASRSGVDLPRVCLARASASSRTNSSPTASASAPRAEAGSVDEGRSHVGERRPAGARMPSPRAPRRSAR